MAQHRIAPGLDLPIAGSPEQRVLGTPRVTRIAFVAADFPGLKPRLMVQVGDTVTRGQLMLEDEAQPGVLHTAQGAGKIASIERAPNGDLVAIVIELSEGEWGGKPGDDDHRPFKNFTGVDPSALTRHDVVALLVESGLWAALRTRPLGRVPSPESRPSALFVTAMDSQPLAPQPESVLTDQRIWFELGLDIVRRLATGPTFLCVRAGSKISAGNAAVRTEEFEGPHPAGTVGVHIHRLHPVGRERSVWHIGYQDVVEVAKLFMTGRLDPTRIVALGGPKVRRPRLVRVRLGASLSEVLDSEFLTNEESVRCISGSVLSGREGRGPSAYLGRYHQQVTVLPEATAERPRSSLLPTAGFSALRWGAIARANSKRVRRYNFTTSAHGASSSPLFIGLYERVMPMDLVVPRLLAALAQKDWRMAERLGALELDEEDLALCAFVCPGKVDYCGLLREALDRLVGEA
jgi:Na+-transporting NADH:ubiquinone oxidoreductase subunit A